MFVSNELPNAAYYNWRMEDIPSEPGYLLSGWRLDGVKFKVERESAQRFKARGSSAYGNVAERYCPIPRAPSVRLGVAGGICGRDTERKLRKDGHVQELLLFEEERAAGMTRVSPTDGTGVLEKGLSESPGSIEFLELELFECGGGVVFRKFARGLVVLNGSKDAAVWLPMAELFPRESYRRLDGKQDPMDDNGQPVAVRVEIPAHDAFFPLKR